MTFTIVIGYIIANFTAKKIFRSDNTHRTVIAIVFLIGVSVSQYAQSYETNSLYPVDDKFIDVCGYVYDIPEENDDSYTYIIKTDMAKYRDKSYDARELIRLTTQTPLTYLQNVEIRGFLKRYNDKMNYTDFDYSRYYKSKGIYYYITDYEVNTDNSLRKTINPFLLIKSGKFYILRIIDNYLDGDYAAILKAVMVGYKKTFSEEYDELMLKTGTKRMLFPAYLHIFLIMLAVEIIMCFFDKKYRDYAVIIALLLYACINSETSVSFKNATVMAATIFAVRKYGVSHYPDIVSGVMMIILLFNPLLVYNSGMMTSCAIGWSSFMLREPITKRFGFIKNRKVRNFIVAWIICNVGAIPMIAFYFNTVNIYSVLLNFIYFPVVTMIVFCFPVFILEMLIFNGSLLIRYALTFGVVLLYKLPYAVEKLPYHEVMLSRPGILMTVIFYLCIIAIKDIYYHKFSRLRTKLITLMICGGIISVHIVSLINSGSAEITFVNVGQGDGAVIELPKGETIIVDGGGGEEYSDYDAGKEIFVPYLIDKGIFRIDMAILTHYHKDHCLGTIAAMKKLDVQAVAMPDVMKENKYRMEIEQLAKEKDIDIIFIETGDKITFESGAVIKVISPEPENYYDDENDTSVLFELECNGFKALFTGDATKNTEIQHMDRFVDVDLLKVAHHGSAYSTTQEFLDRVKPECSVISVGENNTYMHPDDGVVDRLERAGGTIYRTDMNGDIRVFVKKNGEFEVNTFRSVEW